MIERLPKPPHGAPCNRCGMCCEEELCVLGAHVFGDQAGPCPALSYDGQLSVCGLVDAPATFVRTRAAMKGPLALAKAAATLIGAGIGCDAQAVDEPADWNFRVKMAAWRNAHGAQFRAALKTWGVRQL